jgi:hypothetical protein
VAHDSLIGMQVQSPYTVADELNTSRNIPACAMAWQSTTLPPTLVL